MLVERRSSCKQFAQFLVLCYTALYCVQVLLLGLLINSSMYETYRTKSTFLPAQVGFIVADSACIIAGSVLGLPGLTNTAIVFTVLYGLERYRDLHMSQSWNLWVLFLMASLV